MKFAYFGQPHTGGTWTVFTALRQGLAPHGVEVEWLGVGPRAQAAADDPRWADVRNQGRVLAGQEEDERRQGEALVNFLEDEGRYDGVFVNVLANRAQTNAMRYLREDIRRVMIVHNITPATYAAARSIRDHVHATVGVSPRIRQDLVERHGFDAARTQAIPNAIDLQTFAQPRSPRAPGQPLRVLFLGRVVDADKGVFWLPKIMERLPVEVAQLTVVGDGPDMTALQQRCAPLGKRVQFAGRISPAEVPAMLSCHDVFIFPSRFEGLGLSLVEAMAAGCVPVATRLRGVTDFVVQDGQSGVLFEMGNVKAAAKAIERLAASPAEFERMSRAARTAVADRFELTRMAEAYKRVMDTVWHESIQLTQALPLKAWEFPRGVRSGWRTRLPPGIKNLLRGWREKLA